MSYIFKIIELVQQNVKINCAEIVVCRNGRFVDQKLIGRQLKSIQLTANSGRSGNISLIWWIAFSRLSSGIGWRWTRQGTGWALASQRVPAAKFKSRTMFVYLCSYHRHTHDEQNFDYFHCKRHAVGRCLPAVSVVTLTSCADHAIDHQTRHQSIELFLQCKGR